MRVCFYKNSFMLLFSFTKKIQLQFTERENDTLRCQLEQMLQKITPQEKNLEELKYLKAELEEKTSSLKIYQQTQLEYNRIKEECVKNDVAKKKLEAKLKKVEDSAVNQMKEFKQLKLEKKRLEKQLHKMQKKISVFQKGKSKKEMKNAQTQIGSENPVVKLDTQKIKLLLEQLWDCIDSSTEKSHIELQTLDARQHRVREKKNGKRHLNVKNLDDSSVPPSHSSPLALNQMHMNPIQLPVSQTLHKPEVCQKESKSSVEAVVDCNGDSAFYEDKTTDFVTRDLIDEYSSPDHIRYTSEFLQMLQWVKPLPALLSPIHFYPSITQDLFGELTDSSDGDERACAESFLNPIECLKSDAIPACVNDQICSVPLNLPVFDKSADIYFDSKRSKEKHEVAVIESLKDKTDSDFESSNHVPITAEIQETSSCHQHLQCPDNFEIPALIKETCMESCDLGQDYQLRASAVSEVKHTDSSEVSVEMDLGVQEDLSNTVQEAKDTMKNHVDFPCSMSSGLLTSNNSRTSSASKCDAEMPKSFGCLQKSSFDEVEGLVDGANLIGIQEDLTLEEHSSVTKLKDHFNNPHMQESHRSTACENTGLTNTGKTPSEMETYRNKEHAHTEEIKPCESLKKCSESIDELVLNGNFASGNITNLFKDSLEQFDNSSVLPVCLSVNNKNQDPVHLNSTEAKDNLESVILPKQSSAILPIANEELAVLNTGIVKKCYKPEDKSKVSSRVQSDAVKADITSSSKCDSVYVESNGSKITEELKINTEEQEGLTKPEHEQCKQSGYTLLPKIERPLSKITLQELDDLKNHHAQTQDDFSDIKLHTEQNGKMVDILNFINSSLTGILSEMSINPNKKSHGLIPASVNNVIQQKESNVKLKEYAKPKTSLTFSNTPSIATVEKDIKVTADDICKERNVSVCKPTSHVLETVNISLGNDCKVKLCSQDVFQNQPESLNMNLECTRKANTLLSVKGVDSNDNKLILRDPSIKAVLSVASDHVSKSAALESISTLKADPKNDVMNSYISNSNKSPKASPDELDSDISTGNVSLHLHTSSEPVVKKISKVLCPLEENQLKVNPDIKLKYLEGSQISQMTKGNLNIQDTNTCLASDDDESDDDVLVRKVSFKNICSTNLSKTSFSIEMNSCTVVDDHTNNNHPSGYENQSKIFEADKLVDYLKKGADLDKGTPSKSILREAFMPPVFCNSNIQSNEKCVSNPNQNRIKEPKFPVASPTPEMLKPDAIELKVSTFVQLGNSIPAPLSKDLIDGESTVSKKSEAKCCNASSCKLQTPSANLAGQCTTHAENCRKNIPGKNLIWNFDRSDFGCETVYIPSKQYNTNMERKSISSRSSSQEQCSINTQSDSKDLNILTQSVPETLASTTENCPSHKISHGRSHSQNASVGQTILANADTSTKTDLSPEMLNKVRSEMGPPLPPLLGPLLPTPPRSLKPLSPGFSSSSRSSLPSPLDDFISPLRATPIPPLVSPLSDNRRRKSPIFTTPSPSEKEDSRILSSPLQFCAATPKHALPVPGRLPPSAAGGSISSVQENSVKILDTMYPELSARARTLNILKGNVQLNRCLPGDCKSVLVNQITGFKAITSSSTAFIKTGSNSKTNVKDKQRASESPQLSCNKRTTAGVPMPKSAKRLRLDSESPGTESIKDCFPIPANKVPVGKKQVESFNIGYCNSKSQKEIAKDQQVDDAVSNALKKIEELCFDLFPVIRSHVFVGTIPNIPVMRNEEKEVIYEFSRTRKNLSDLLLHAILKTLKAEKASLDGKYLQAFCRVYVGLCRQLGDLEKARVLCYSILKEDFQEPEKLLLFIISTWNDMFSLPGIINKAVQALLKQLAKDEVLICLSAYLNWEKNPPMPVATILSSVLMAIQLCPDVKFQASKEFGEDLTEPIWEYVFAVDLLCCHRKWMWTHDQVIRKELWPVLDRYVKYKKGRVTIPCVPDIIVATVLRLIGRLCQIGLKEGHVTTVKNIASVIIAFIQHAKEEDIPWGVQLASVYMLCDVAPSDPAVIYKTLQSWRETTTNDMPPAITKSLAQVASLCK
ncbi:little elongation complex subunit 1 isoform X1 [Pelobates cultripes]|uniref:Little elongation complex subunit 1 isoform X1 n=1 Tax=Pelobates cultripes TaxID=61616 RepID=A0AAD1RXX6_PELCU|nr:little elongation complex subunit 1 isoform X1 [Pelobates cultripes]